MSKRSKRSGRSPGKERHSQISQQILMRYILSVLGMIGGFVLLFFLAWLFCRLFIWQAYDPLYRFLKAMENTMLFWGGALILLGMFLLTYRSLSKPLDYLDEVIAAAEQLAHPDETPIRLSPAMASVQDELNMVREGALRSAIRAKEEEQRKNDLIVYLAHDLKTPLTSVIGYLTLLRDEPQLSPEMRAKYTGIAWEKAQRLETLINEFFEITRFSLSQITLQEEYVNLTRMLEQITFEFQPALAEKDLSWDLSLAPDVVGLCDPDKLERVFDNLLRNAINYSYHGTAIQVSLEKTSESIVVTVKNSGQTIPPEKLARIFEQFFRLDASRSSSSGGAGLGLAIAKEIVELHGGTIRAESAEDSVSFTVTLPAVSMPDSGGDGVSFQ
ncbi:MAG: HAMP domain-containing sensor histidine kinase [Bacillota bacterium]|nr:HAMP domain-containing sensor histidine kinase [Bacillota bacterium]